MAAGDSYLDPISPILDTWVAWTEAAKAGHLWGDDRNPDRNVIMDSETMLTLLWPEASVSRLQLRPAGDELAPSSKAAGAALGRLAGDAEDGYDVDLNTFLPSVRKKLLQVFVDYFERHAGVDRPSFAAGSYLFEEGTPPWGEGIEVTDAYTFSLTASLTMLRLLDRWYPTEDSVEDDGEIVERIRDLARDRLTWAMQGLIDSFTVSKVPSAVFKRNTGLEFPKGDDELDRIRLRLHQLRTDRRLTGSAFEVGWSWGPVAPDVRLASDGEEEPHEYAVYAEPAPYLYFTVGALDGINDLFDEAVAASQILDRSQRELSQTLRVMYDLTVRYWTSLALSGEVEGRWAIENLPWSTSDAKAEEYWTLYLLRVVMRKLEASEHDSGRLLALAQELAQRGRITRVPAPASTDAALANHYPGLKLELQPAEESKLPEALEWAISDYSPQLMKLSGQLLGRVRSHRERAELQSLISRIWVHMQERRKTTGVLVWDSLGTVGAYSEWYKEITKHNKGADPYAAKVPREYQFGSWYITERMMEALVAVADGEAARPQVPVEMRNLLFELIGEVDYAWALRATSEADNKDVLKTRRALHDAREELLSRQTMAAYEKVTKLLGDLAPQSTD